MKRVFALLLSLAVIVGLAGAEEFPQQVAWTEYTEMRDTGWVGHYIVRNADGLYGVMELPDKIVIPCEYEVIESYVYSGKSPSPAKKDGKWGCVWQDGTTAVPFVYDAVRGMEDAGTAVCKNGKWGVLDYRGETTLPCAYEDVTALSWGSWGLEKLYAGKTEGMWSLYWPDGRPLDGERYESVSGLGAMSAMSVIVVEQGGKFGALSLQPAWDYVRVPCVYDELVLQDEYIYAAARKGDKWGAVSLKDGREAPFTLDERPVFSENFAVMHTGEGAVYLHIKEGEALSWEQAYGGPYEDALPFQEGLARIKRDGKWGAIDHTGSTVIPFVYDEIGDGDWNPIRVVRDGLTGYVDHSGKEIVAPCYESGGDLVDYFAFAVVKKDGKSGLIDETGSLVVPMGDWDFPEEPAPEFYEGVAVAVRDGKYGLVDGKGRVVAPFQYDYMGQMRQNFTIVEQNGRWGLLQNPLSTAKAGEVEVYWLPQFAWVEVLHGGERLAVRKEAEGPIGLAALDGTMVAPFQYETIETPEAGNDGNLIDACKDGLWGRVDEDGNVVKPFVYRSWQLLNFGVEVDYRDRSGGPVDESDYGAGEVPSVYDGLVDNDGNVVAPFVYDMIGVFKAGRALAIRDGRYGVLDLTGREVVPCQYDRVDWAGEYRFAVYLDGKAGFLDWDGNELLPIQYERVDVVETGLPHGGDIRTPIGNYFYNGVCAVYQEGGKLTFINAKGEEVETPDYDILSQLNLYGFHGFNTMDGEDLHVREDGTAYYDDGKGNVVEVSGYHEYVDTEDYISSDGLHCGVNDANDEMVLPPIYDQVSLFENGWAMVAKDGVYGVAKDPRLASAVSGWAKDEVERAGGLGLVTARTERYQTYPVTRLQFAELAVNLAEKALGTELPAAPADRFADTADTAVLKAAEAGIVNGTGDGTAFEPDAFITREQMAAMLYRTLETMGDTAEGGDLSAYADHQAVSEWARTPLSALVERGIMKGTSENTLSPGENTTVEQAILLVLRAHGA